MISGKGSQRDGPDSEVGCSESGATGLGLSGVSGFMSQTCLSKIRELPFLIQLSNTVYRVRVQHKTFWVAPRGNTEWRHEKRHLLTKRLAASLHRLADEDRFDQVE